MLLCPKHPSFKMFSIPAGDDLSGVTSGEYPATAGESECVALTPKTDLKKS